MSEIWRFIRILCVRYVPFGCFLVTPLLADDSIDWEQIKATIDARSKAIAGYAWDFEFERFECKLPTVTKGGPETLSELLRTRASKGIADSDKKAAGTFSGHVIAGIEEHRFKIVAERFFPWLQGAAPFVQMFDTIGFDGASYWDLEFAGHRSSLDHRLSDADLTKERSQQCFGTIANDAPVGGRLEQLIDGSGYCFRPGYFSMPQGMASGASVSLTGLIRTMQQSGVEITVHRLDETRVEIILPIMGDVETPDDDGEAAIVLRSDQLYSIETVVYQTDPELKFVNAQFKLDNVELEPGVWFPAELTWMSPPNESGTRIKFSNIAIRENLKSADFEIQFPDGIRINDHRNKTSYVASKSPRDEELAIREFAATFLGDLDGLKRFQTARKSAPQLYRIWLILGSTLVLGIILLIFYYRSNRTTTTLILFFSITLTCATAHAGDLSPAEVNRETNKANLESPFVWNSERGWILRTPFVDGCKNTVSQCGQRVAMFALTAFDRSYDPMQLSRYLKPDADGIGMDLIFNVLRSHHLDVDARKNVSWRQLETSLSQNMICIVAIPAREFRPAHYVCVIRRTDGQLHLIDPPNGSKSISLDKRLRESHIPELNVLLISDMEYSTVDDLKVPRLIQLEPNADDCLTPVDVTFEVTNTSTRPVWINQVRVSCGCVQADLVSPVVLPRSAESIRLTVSPRKWGQGYQRKTVQLEIGNGELLTVELAGEFIRPSGANILSGSGIKTVKIPVELSATQYTTRIDIAVDDALFGNYRALVDPGASWCSAEYDSLKHMVHVSVDLKESILQRVRFSEDLSARVQLIGPLLAGTWQIDVRQDLNSIRFQSRIVTPKDLNITFNITAPVLRQQGWKPRIVGVEVVDSLAEEEVVLDERSGQFAVSTRLRGIPQRPVAGSVQFDHPTYLPIQIPIVVMP